MKFVDLSQKDERWADDFIGNSPLLMRDYGCTVTSLCMLIGDLRGSPCSPKDAAKHWNFTRDGKLYWSTPFEGVDFVWRGGEKPDRTELKRVLESDDMRYILEVRRKGWTTRHWVFPRYYKDGRLYVSDPWLGETIPLPETDTIIGYALFRKEGGEVVRKLSVIDWGNEFAEVKEEDLPMLRLLYKYHKHYEK